jgi:hypothetical protein
MEEFEDHGPMCEGAAGEFTDHERMTPDLTRLRATNGAGHPIWPRRQIAQICWLAPRSILFV